MKKDKMVVRTPKKKENADTVKSFSKKKKKKRRKRKSKSELSQPTFFD